MQLHRITFPMLLGFFLTGTIVAPHVVAQEKIFFSIQDAASGPNYKESAAYTTCTEANAYLDIAGTYTVSVGGASETITISPPTGSSEKARIICDEANDMLILKNATIKTTTGPATNIKIAFWRKFVTLPVSPADYSVSADGNFAGNPNGSWLSLRGYIDTNVLGDLVDPPPNPPNCMLQLTRCATANPASWPFTSASFSTIENVSFPDPRTLKGQFWFKLAANTHSLNFSPTKGIQVKFGPPPGPDPVTPPACPEGQQCRPPCRPCSDFPKPSITVIIALGILTAFLAIALWRRPGQPK